VNCFFFILTCLVHEVAVPLHLKTERAMNNTDSVIINKEKELKTKEEKI